MQFFLATFSCQKDIAFPRFASLIETLVLVIDASVTFTFKSVVTPIPPVFQQYILVSAYQSSGDGNFCGGFHPLFKCWFLVAAIEVYDNVNYFSAALEKLAEIGAGSPAPRDVRVALKESLKAIVSVF